MDWLGMPALALSFVDDQLSGWLTQPARLVVWSAAAGLLTMLTYATLSPQSGIRRLKRRAESARAELSEFDGEFSEAVPLMGQMLRAAFAQLALVLGPAAVAIGFAVLIAAWVDQRYGRTFPQADVPVPVQTVPQDRVSAEWIPPPVDGGKPRVAVADRDGRRLGDIEVSQPVPVIQKRTWQAALTGSPLGFLPDALPVDRIEIQLPSSEYLRLGPDWMRGWEFTFFAVLTIVALAVKRAFHLE